MKAILLSLSLVFAGQALATEEQLKFDDSEQKALYGELIKELRCPKCQNQNIADSNAVVAKDMRAKTKQLVEQGRDKEQVIDYMVNRYGQFAHYQPPLNIATSLLWLLPVLFISLAVMMLVKRSRRQSLTNVTESETVADETNTVKEAELDEALDALLAKASNNDKQSVKDSNSKNVEGDK